MAEHKSSSLAFGRAALYTGCVMSYVETAMVYVPQLLRTTLAPELAVAAEFGVSEAVRPGRLPLASMRALAHAQAGLPMLDGVQEGIVYAMVCGARATAGRDEEDGDGGRGPGPARDQERRSLTSRSAR